MGTALPISERVTYLDKHNKMTDEELLEYAQHLFKRVANSKSTDIGLIELRNVVPALIDRLREKVGRTQPPESPTPQ
ncbi:hypothetical protein [Novosphingobium sp. KN65.2]|uniref:hypothetical protein n=1 Tax=Novosphingobium sp. KN65.2 TaxID=1478134 RepID=UPI0005DF89B7|nr:hypothetical protein [Novosphingobium sp. KN65.2]CDO36070.1 hypothetical protein SPHV1_230009 [Novosphingobium sp. KN65.2]